jgi:hypothetical protein
MGPGGKGGGGRISVHVYTGLHAICTPTSNYSYRCSHLGDFMKGALRDLSIGVILEHLSRVFQALLNVLVRARLAVGKVEPWNKCLH